MRLSSNRLIYLDWVRGLAAAIMLQGHVFDAWVRPQDRTSEWFWLSQFLGGLPAPAFLFLSGVSLALALDKMRGKAATPFELASKVARRGSWILLLAYAFRIEQYWVWYPASRWTDIFRIDTLNCIAVCTLAIGLLSVLFKTRAANIKAMGVATLGVVWVTPWVYPVRANLPNVVLSYLNGNGNSYYFSLFPWVAFALAGMTFGYVLLDSRERIGESELFKRVAVFAICVYAVGAGMGLSPFFEYGFFDYSLTSPHFFFVRLGWILLIFCGAYKWSNRVTAGRWSPMRALGQASLLVYWVHIEIVYGKAFHHYAQALDLAGAARQLVWVMPLMVGLAAVRQLRWKFQPRVLEPQMDLHEGCVKAAGRMQPQITRITQMGPSA